MAQARGVLGSTPGDCWAFHFSPPNSFTITVAKQLHVQSQELHVHMVLTATLSTMTVTKQLPVATACTWKLLTSTDKMNKATPITLQVLTTM